jgi:hypothetical protein
MLYLMDELAALLTPEVLTAVAYIAGAFLVVATVIAGMVWVADNFSRWF